MRTVYIADDGKQFEDEYECEHHEFELKHPHLQTIEAYNKDGEKMTDLLMKIHIIIVKKLFFIQKKSYLIYNMPQTV